MELQTRPSTCSLLPTEWSDNEFAFERKLSIDSLKHTQTHKCNGNNYSLIRFVGGKCNDCSGVIWQVLFDYHPAFHVCNFSIPSLIHALNFHSLICTHTHQHTNVLSVLTPTSCALTRISYFNYYYHHHSAASCESSYISCFNAK